MYYFKSRDPKRQVKVAQFATIAAVKTYECCDKNTILSREYAEQARAVGARRDRFG
jgi:hypothetical protein